MTRSEQQAMADQMIGAAQRLEAAARDLKTQAKIVRQGTLHRTMTVELWTMHKVHDIKRAASGAVSELVGEPVSLTEAAQ